MSSYTKNIGDIGTSVIISEFLKHNINVLIPYDDNSPYDLVIYVDGKFYKIQIKTTEKVKYNEYMEFSMTKTNPYKKVNVPYKEGEVDYFALYCVENDWCGLLNINDYSKTLRVRTKIPSNNQMKNLKFMDDLDFHNGIVKYFGKNYLKDNIEHTEVKKKRDRKTKICPYCNKNKIKENNNMCRACYLLSVSPSKV